MARRCPEKAAAFPESGTIHSHFQDNQKERPQIISKWYSRNRSYSKIFEGNSSGLEPGKIVFFEKYVELGFGKPGESTGFFPVTFCLNQN